MKTKIKKIRVLLLFPHYNSLRERGSLRSSQIGFFLSKKGYDVTVFAPGIDLRTGKKLPEFSGKLYYDTRIDNVRVIRPRCLDGLRRSVLHRLVFESLFSISIVYLSFLLKKRPHVIVGAYPPAILPLPSLSQMIAFDFVFLTNANTGIIASSIVLPCKSLLSTNFMFS